MKKKIPKFKSEDDEREFWSKADSTEYIDWNKADVPVQRKEDRFKIWKK